MANGIDSRFTNVLETPTVVDRETSLADIIAPLAQIAMQDTARQDALKIKYAEMNQKAREADALNDYRNQTLKNQAQEAVNLKDYRTQALENQKLDNQKRNELAEERNQIARDEMEVQQRDKSEREDFSAIQTITDDWEEKSRQLRSLAEKTGKSSYSLMADNIEKRGLAMRGISPIKQNLMNENNPYKIREYIRREGEDLEKYFPGSSARLTQRADYLDKQYAVTEKEVVDSDIYKTALLELEVRIGLPGAWKIDPETKAPYSMAEYSQGVQQAKIQTQNIIQSSAVPEGIAPLSEEDISAIWDNEQARTSWLENPLDDINEIKKKFEMIEEPEDKLTDENTEKLTDENTEEAGGGKATQPVGMRSIMEAMKKASGDAVFSIEYPDGKVEELRGKEVGLLGQIPPEFRDSIKVSSVKEPSFSPNKMKRDALRIFALKGVPVYEIGGNQPLKVERPKKGGYGVIVNGTEYTTKEFSEKFTNTPTTIY